MANEDPKHAPAGHGRPKSNHNEEYISIAMSLALAVFAVFFFFRMPNWQPTGTFYHYVMAWTVLAYLAAQLVVLLATAIDSRSIGFLDSLFSLLPAITGAIIGVNALQGLVKLSTFQENALLLMIGTSVLEALITLWVRFTVNRRTIGLDPGS